jgi:mono/diheme cytochrome c family protein
MQTKCAVGAVLLLLLTGSVEAAHGYYDPSVYEKGGFAPASDAKYQSECGACHFAYLPGLLPARSWEALLKKPDEHFGEALSLDPETLRHIREYVTANAGDRSDFTGPKQFLHRLPDESTPLRITSLRMFKHYHSSVLFKMGLASGLNNVRELSPQARKAMLNCSSCHEKAAGGSFAQREIIIRGGHGAPTRVPSG